jgi:hypothetical protein
VDAIISGVDFLLPVIGGKFDAAAGGDANFSLAQIFGTCFWIGGSYWMTNQHAIEAATSHELAGVVWDNSGRLTVTQLQGPEALPGLDIAIFKATIPNPTGFQWDADSVPLLAPVQAVGYPHALDLHHKRIHLRAFGGSIVSGREWEVAGSMAQVYELSFACPRGLSGAPLLLSTTTHVAGVVFGNAKMDITVSSDQETTQDVGSGGTTTTIVNNIESLHLGLAFTSQQILATHSTLLGKTVREHLDEVGLLAPPRPKPVVLAL